MDLSIYIYIYVYIYVHAYMYARNCKTTSTYITSCVFAHVETKCADSWFMIIIIMLFYAIQPILLLLVD